LLPEGARDVDDVTVLGDASEDVARFLNTFQRASHELDLEALNGCFAEVFLAADANGSYAVPRQAFLDALPKRAAAAAGIGRAALRSAHAQSLDDHWILLRTLWAAPRSDGQELDMASSFLLHRDGTELRAAVYLNHEGLPQAMA
jgi:hypothetical protein